MKESEIKAYTRRREIARRIIDRASAREVQIVDDFLTGLVYARALIRIGSCREYYTEFPMTKTFVDDVGIDTLQRIVDERSNYIFIELLSNNPYIATPKGLLPL